MSEVNNIHTAINAIMKEVGYVQKTKVTGLNYTFAGESALIQALRPSMVEHGVYVYVARVFDVKRENYTTAKGTQMVNTCVTGVVAFVHAPSNTQIEVTSMGEGSDSGDKSQNKAMTGLYKYALRQTFCIETGDDPDRFDSAEQERPAIQVEKKVSENHKSVPADDIQRLRKEFGEIYNAANRAGTKNLPTISGKSDEKEIKNKIAEIQALIGEYDHAPAH